MKHLFLDTNVVLDFLSDRKPHSTDAAVLFELAEKEKVTLHLSAISYNNIYYIIRRVVGYKKALALLSEIAELVYCIELNEGIINKAMKSDFPDFEDAIQFYSALSNNKINAIVTRNTKDYKKSTISIVSPKEAVTIIN
jgi:predicted nucleic acid-binding protein